jgi:hypothetical protein
MSRILVLGMACVNDAYIEKSFVPTGTTSSPLRDRLRIDALARHLQCEIITFNDNQTQQDCDPHMHYNGVFSHRGIKGLFNAMQQKYSHVTFHNIYLDYFRFPGAYMLSAYKNIASMLIEMVFCEMLVLGSHIIIPRFDGLDECLMTIADHSIFSRHDYRPYYLEYQRIESHNYPLYVVTEKLWQETPGAILSIDQNPQVCAQQSLLTQQSQFIHSDQVMSLHDIPFLKLTVVESKQRSSQSWKSI